MKCTITINMDNAAFHEMEQAELSRILRKIASAVAVGEMESLTAHDINGNKVGTLEIER